MQITLILEIYQKTVGSLIEKEWEKWKKEKK